jgi:hypothetical protein
LDHLLDTVEAGPQSRQQILESTAVDRNTMDQALFRAVEAEEIERVDRGLYKLAPPKPKAQPAAAAPPPLAVAEGDVELFTALLTATGGHVVTGQPRGTGITDLRMIHSMLQSGADLEADILPTLRGHVGELAQRPLEGWTAPWFVQGVAAAHRRRLEAAQSAAPAPAKPPQPAIDDAELLDRLVEAAGGNVYTNASIMSDLAPIRVMLADGVELDDILRALRDKVDPRVTHRAAALRSWEEPRFLRHVAEAHLRRTVVPGWVGRWLKTLHGEPAGAPEPSAAVLAPPAPENVSATSGGVPAPHPDESLAVQRETIAARFARARPEPGPPGEQEEPDAQQFDWSELVAGHRAGTFRWDEQAFGPPPGEVGCRAPAAILRAEGYRS